MSFYVTITISKNIISCQFGEAGSPTYRLSKRLVELLTPYIPRKYSLKSAGDFLELLASSSAEGFIASLDVESLFTNVPVDTTIDYILNNVYRHEELPPLDIPELLLKKMLELCTKESPFLSPRGRMYKQVDGVAMGSP